MRKITTKKRILFSFRGQVTINGQIMSEKPGIFCAQNGQKIVGFRTAWGYEPVGQARVDYNMARCGEISYSIDAAYRCNGYGTRMLGLLEEMEEIKKKTDRLCAVVKITNTASQRCFEKLGYLKSFKEDMVYYVKDI